MDLLTTTEAADYLRIKERKLYELVAERQIPCTKVTGKWLFPRGELDRWLLAGLARPLGVVPADPPPIIGGSHDPLLQWALLESRCELASLAEGSEAGYRKLLAGQGPRRRHPFPRCRRSGRGRQRGHREPRADTLRCCAGRLCRSRAGLAGGQRQSARDRPAWPASPHRRRASPCARKAPARNNSCTPCSIAEELDQSKLILAAGTCPTGPDIAQAIRGGHADCGIATRTVADGGRPRLRAARPGAVRPAHAPARLLPHAHAGHARLLAEARFAARARELGGLDVSGAGQIRWAP